MSPQILFPRQRQLHFAAGLQEMHSIALHNGAHDELVLDSLTLILQQFQRIILIDRGFEPQAQSGQAEAFRAAPWLPLNPEKLRCHEQAAWSAREICGLWPVTSRPSQFLLPGYKFPNPICPRAGAFHPCLPAGDRDGGGLFCLRGVAIITLGTRMTFALVSDLKPSMDPLRLDHLLDPRMPLELWPHAPPIRWIVPI